MLSRNVFEEINNVIPLYKQENIAEEGTIQGILYPILKYLGWDICNPLQIVRNPYNDFGQACDIGLSTTNTREGICLLIEVKRINENIDKYLLNSLKYPWQQAVSNFILTNGQTWYFMLPHAPVPPKEKIILSLSFGKDSIEELSSTFESLLRKEYFLDGRAESQWKHHYEINFNKKPFLVISKIVSNILENSEAIRIINKVAKTEYKTNIDINQIKTILSQFEIVRKEDNIPNKTIPRLEGRIKARNKLAQIFMDRFISVPDLKPYLEENCMRISSGADGVIFFILFPSSKSDHLKLQIRLSKKSKKYNQFLQAIRSKFTQMNISEMNEREVLYKGTMTSNIWERVIDINPNDDNLDIDTISEWYINILYQVRSCLYNYEVPIQFYK